MEVMEDGNLMDKVNILIQRDMEYYKDKQSVLQETVCPGIIGGHLDFPRSASFAAIKLVFWWEDEYEAAYRKPSGFLQKHLENKIEHVETTGGCGGIVKASDPLKFITALSKSANQLLEHLHVLTQEALDHADLTVLTGVPYYNAFNNIPIKLFSLGTIGAAALLKNCLWFYIQILNETKGPSIQPIQTGYKKYHEMCEALAERLLDLHCRLLSLYILQDADCLDWENQKPFFESERGSYIIQMWWLYMQGTKEDLWNTVPPKMAQRVFSGMLNESLTILTVRYTQSCPSEARTELLLVDVSNVLFCVAQMLPSICDSAEELSNSVLNGKSKTLRDIHVKCQELYACFLLRGAPLDSLFKIFKNNTESIAVLKPKLAGPVPWITFALPNIFKMNETSLIQTSDQDYGRTLGIELMVLLAQPQPKWALLLKILCSNNFKILNLLLNEFMQRNVELKKVIPKSVDCGNLLCPADGSCRNVDATSKTLNSFHYYELIMSASFIFLHVGNDEEIKEFFIDVITKPADWAKCFERRQVWNQIRFPWYEALINLATPILALVGETVINALRTGATMYQAMSLIVACFSQYWDILDTSLLRAASLFQEIIPSEITPISDSVLMQILVSSLYTYFITNSEDKKVTFQMSKQNSLESVSNQGPESVANVALAAAESLCSIDEDNKHTDQIEEFLNQVNGRKDEHSSFANLGSESLNAKKSKIIEIVASDLLMSNHGKRSLKLLYHFIKHNTEWLYWKLGISGKNYPDTPNKVLSSSEPLLNKMFYIGYYPFDQLLTKQLKPNWQNLLQTSMGLTLEKVWMQLSCRWEFRNSTSPKLSNHAVEIVNKLSSILKQEKS
ncbi:hypothetical protein ABEB36_005401 [Hypothenemus hampei]|uniref:Uncharacterized protein n=1 Tax=Hypothenemus hampei TaxID=57062 RepID=A0ABD1EY42_HYPHA